MTVFAAIHNWIQRWQEKKSSRYILCTVLTGIVLTYFVPLIMASWSLYESRTMLFDLLTGPEQHVAAMQLEDTGFVEISGKQYGDERLKGFQILDEENYVIDPASATALILSSDVPTWAPPWLLQNPNMAIGVTALAIFWCIISVFLGLFRTMLYAVLMAFFAFLLSKLFGFHKLAFTLTSICVLAYSYQLCLKLLQSLLRSPRQVPSVARGVLIEATRTKLSLAFITLLLVLLPTIPALIDAESPLRHQIQTMLSRSLGVSFGIAAFLTVFLGCATIAFEIRDRQIWQVLTKPVGKFGYIFGKWLGIATLNLALLTIAGISIFLYLQFLRTAPVVPGVQGELDRLAVNEEVLTARADATPIFEELTNEQIAARVEALIEADPDLRNEESIQVQLRQKLREDVQEQHLAQQRSIPPMRGGVYAQTYTFTGLEHAKKMGTPLAFKYRFHIGQSDEHETYEAGFAYNGDMGTRHSVRYIPTMTHVTMIPAEFIKDNGTLDISVYNLYEPPSMYTGKGTMSFDKGGIQLLYRVGDFEGNFFRAMIVLWIKLAFLAALALSASTFLSFPVACMVTLTIFVSGTLAPFLAESLEAYFPPATDKVDFGNIAHVIEWSFENVINTIANVIVWLLDGFGTLRQTDNLVDGMLVSCSAVLKGFLSIGLAWSSGALIIGTIVLRKRQLAIYSGNG